jgi:hypothetical protein
MVVSAVAIAVLLPVAFQRSAPPVDQSTENEPTRSAASSSAPSTSASPPASPSSSAATTSESDGPATVVVLGDGDSAGASAWPVVLEEELGNTEFRVAADAGAGYVVAGAGGRTIPELAEEVDLADADLVVVFGSRNDGAGVADDVAQAADGLFDGIRDAAPDAELLVIGPAWFSEPVPAGTRNNRDVIRTAAESAGATFVDPLEEGWFVDRSELLTGTGNPNQAGHAYLAGQIEPAVRELLPG